MANDFWEQNAENWTQAIRGQGIASRTVTNPAIVEVIRRYQPASLIDMGCGEGFMSELLAGSLPSLQYLGVDGSEGLIAIAQKSFANKKFTTVKYEQILAGQWQAPQKYEALLFNFSLFAEDLSALLQECTRFLTDSGHVFIQTLHPLMALSEYHDGWRVEDFKTMTTPFTGTMPWFGRTLESWSQQFLAAGLRIVEMREPTKENRPLSLIFILEPLVRS